MPDVLQIPGDLTAILRRQALLDYNTATDAAAHAAAACVDGPERDLAELAAKRLSVRERDEAITLLGDNVTKDEAVEVVLDEGNRGLLDALVTSAIESLMAAHFDIVVKRTEDEVVEIADTIRRLRGLLDAPEREAVTA